jgi:hypothetical protein
LVFDPGEEQSDYSHYQIKILSLSVTARFSHAGVLRMQSVATGFCTLSRMIDKHTVRDDSIMQIYAGVITCDAGRNFYGSRRKLQ